MHEGKQVKEPVSRVIRQAEGKGTQQFRLRDNRGSNSTLLIIQREATITMKNGSTPYYGQSSKDGETYLNMKNHPQLLNFFNEKVKGCKIVAENVDDDNNWSTETIDGKLKYVTTRTWAHCAEPNAFSKFVAGEALINKTNLQGCVFPALAKYRGNSKDPCEVCSQWVEKSGSELKLSDSLIDSIPPSGSMKNSEKVKDMTGGITLSYGTRKKFQPSRPADL